HLRVRRSQRRHQLPPSRVRRRRATRCLRQLSGTPQMHRRQVLRSTTALDHGGRTARAARILAVVSLLLIVAVGVGSVKDPTTVRTLHAMRELGPLSGWRCAQLATYVYEP